MTPTALTKVFGCMRFITFGTDFATMNAHACNAANEVLRAAVSADLLNWHVPPGKLIHAVESYKKAAHLL